MYREKNSPKIIKLDQINEILKSADLYTAIKDAFIQYSNGEAVIPPVGELLFDEPPGDVHIKYGYIRSDNYYIVKIASGFYKNPEIGLPSSQGLNLLFDKNSGILLSIILDEGCLTDIRTAVAGSISSQALARSSSKCLGIIGAGTQGRLQLEYHLKIFDIDQVCIWNRNHEKATELAKSYRNNGLNIHVSNSPEELCKKSDIIVTTTPATRFIIENDWVREGTHITAVGSDTSEKIELDPHLLERSDILAVDSMSQSESRGEVFQAKKHGLIQNKVVLELGNVLELNGKVRRDERQVSIADLTGVAVQDLAISKIIYESTEKEI